MKVYSTWRCIMKEQIKRVLDIMSKCVSLERDTLIMIDNATIMLEMGNINEAYRIFKNNNCCDIWYAIYRGLRKGVSFEDIAYEVMGYYLNEDDLYRLYQSSTIKIIEKFCKKGENV